MDEAVRRALAKWPNVPAVSGWLRLDRRGEWWIRLAEDDPSFDRITNPKLIDFISRNYAVDERGRYYFQNGPQRVYVALDYTPYVLRLDDALDGLVAHTGTRITELRESLVDEEGSVILHTELGAGLVLDRDLAALTVQIADAEALLEQVMAGKEIEASLFGQALWLRPILAKDVARRFGFLP
jgi:Protein of unknown function (DUF2946)